VYATVKLVIEKFKTVENISQPKETIHLFRVIVVETYENSAFWQWHRVNSIRSS